MKPSDRKIRDVIDVNEIENGCSSECNLSIQDFIFDMIHVWEKCDF